MVHDGLHPTARISAGRSRRSACTAPALVPTLVSRIVGLRGSGRVRPLLAPEGLRGSGQQPAGPGAGRARSGWACATPTRSAWWRGPVRRRGRTTPRRCAAAPSAARSAPMTTLVTLDAARQADRPRGGGRARRQGPGHLHRLLPQPAGQQQAFTPDGYFRTGRSGGDRGERGNIRITGRIKDIIIRGGENIAARDVEDLISAHPAVEYVAVVGLPDPDLGEVVCAVVKPRAGAGP